MQTKKPPQLQHPTQIKPQNKHNKNHATVIYHEGINQTSKPTLKQTHNTPKNHKTKLITNIQLITSIINEFLKINML